MSSYAAAEVGRLGRAIDLAMLEATPARTAAQTGVAGSALSSSLQSHTVQPSPASTRAPSASAAGPTANVAAWVADADAQRQARLAADAASRREQQDEDLFRTTLRDVRAELTAQTTGVSDELARVKGEVAARFDVLAAMLGEVQQSKERDVQRILAELQSVRPAVTLATTAAVGASTPRGAGGSGVPGASAALHASSHVVPIEMERKMTRLEAELSVVQASLVNQESDTVQWCKALRADLDAVERRVGTEEALLQLTDELARLQQTDHSDLARALATQAQASAASVDGLREEASTVRQGLLLLERNALEKFREVEAAIDALRADVLARDNAYVESLSTLEARVDGQARAAASAQEGLGLVVQAVREDVFGVRADLDRMQGALARLDASTVARPVGEAELARALREVEERVANRCDAQLLMMQRALADATQAVNGLRTDLARLAAGQDETAAKQREVNDDLRQRISQTTHVCVANDMAFRGLKDRVAAMMAEFEAPPPPNAAEIERFLRSIA